MPCTLTHPVPARTLRCPLLTRTARLPPNTKRNVGLIWLFNRPSRRPAADALRPASLLVVNVLRVRFLLAPSRSGTSLPCSVRAD
jgi:hypothetical protein